jgi:hypothetical protein
MGNIPILHITYLAELNLQTFYTTQTQNGIKSYWRETDTLCS